MRRTRVTDGLATDRNPADVQRVPSRILIREVPTMTKRLPVFAVAVLLAGSGVASARASAARATFAPKPSTNAEASSA